MSTVKKSEAAKQAGQPKRHGTVQPVGSLSHTASKTASDCGTAVNTSDCSDSKVPACSMRANGYLRPEILALFFSICQCAIVSSYLNYN